MSAVTSAFRYVLQRSLANWKLLTSIVIGVLIAVMLVSSMPLYSNALSDLGIKHAINAADPQMINLDIYRRSYSDVPGDYQKVQTFLDTQIEKYMGDLISRRERFAQIEPFLVTRPGQTIQTGSFVTTGNFWYWTQLEQHVNVLEGRLPASAGPINNPVQTEKNTSNQDTTADTTSDYKIEALITVGAAKLNNINPGDEIILSDNIPGRDATKVTVLVTGIIEPLDANDKYWQVTPEIFTPTSSSDEGSVIPLYVPEDTMFNVVKTLFPGKLTVYHMYFYVDTAKITFINARSIANNVKIMEQNIWTGLPNTEVFNSLGRVINDFLDKQLFTQIPLFLLIFQIVGIILYYVATISNMVIEQEMTEIALLRSRGANTTQVFIMLFMEGILITLIGGTVGPFLGGLIFGLLGKTSPFKPLSNGGLLPVHFTNTVFILAAISTVLCFLAFIVPAIQASRRGVVQQRQQLARPSRAPFWQRYYIDIILLVMGTALYYELKTRGTLVQQGIFGQKGMDPLVLITPLLFMIAVAIIFLRIFPLLMIAMEKIGRNFASSPVIISLRQMARNPIHYTRLILLLMMAASVGTFSVSFLGTLNRSYYERTMYSVGADVRVEGLRNYSSDKQTLTDLYSGVQGVQQTSVVSREKMSLGSGLSFTDGNLLAIDPVSMADITWFRPDFAGKPLPALMADLAQDTPQPEGMVLPKNAESIGVWAMAENIKVHLWARVRDADDQTWSVDLGSPSSGEWQYLETSLKNPIADRPPRGPLTLLTLWLASPIIMSGGTQGVYMDNLQVRVAGAYAPIVIETFETTTAWTPLTGEGTVSSSVLRAQDTLKTVTSFHHDGEKSVFYSWPSSISSSSTYRGIYANVDKRPLRAIASSQFVKNTGASLGMILDIRLPGQYIQVQVTDAVDYFPTMDPSVGFILVNIDRFFATRSRQLGGIASYPNEVWMSLTTDTTSHAVAVKTIDKVTNQAQHIYDKNQILADQKSDPLIAAGWGGVLALAFFGVALVSILGFIVYAYLSARRRQLEFAVLRTIGFSLRQIISLIGFEQIFIIVAGMGIGTFIGMQLSGVMMQFLQLTEHGEQVVPPFMFVTDWQTILAIYGLLATAFTVTISLIVLFFTRISLNRTLRMGDQ